ncbi:hypothetical protein KY290_024961 [Solanum tuberosum]|uniref:Leucine-rich repeat-containing N-terminal plant-type domain-containing protein n=1 Tax=Solanum tuberosum TaxID=4113 RepID=A0ABQ7USB0_SOLTU|nr:hypothetical protein KY284_023819 [Solanum tuberosum]KAH0754691.1 hypothetical protein KY290_024961 [Solanum tuberosum]
MGSNQFSFMLFLCFCLLSFSSAILHPCRKDQRAALLKFKKPLTLDPSLVTCSSNSYTSSWNRSRDCCSWDGVICDEMTGHVIELNLSCSGLVGKIDSNNNLFQLSRLQRLDLSSNNFSNSHILPELRRFSSLTLLDLSDSYFSGHIPSEISHLSQLQSLHFSPSFETILRLTAHDLKLLFENLTQLRELEGGNSAMFGGKIPQSLINCKQLEGDNHLMDTFPVLLGTLPKLKVLSLRSNKLHGSIRTLTSQNMFPHLQILDLSSNAFTKNIPSGLFQHFKAMRTIHQTMNAPSDEWDRYYQDSVALVTKGLDLEVVRILFLYTTVDLSNNKFERHIPSIMGDLTALRVISCVQVSQKYRNRKKMK